MHVKICSVRLVVRTNLFQGLNMGSIPIRNTMIGIYKIENLINGKVYIGQSLNIKQRWNKHKVNFKNLKRLEKNKPLYCAFRKYGLENFSFEIIQLCDKNSLNKLEIFYILQYCSNNSKNGYNISLRESNSVFVKLNNEIHQNIIKELSNLNKSKKQIAEEFNISIQYLNKINKGLHLYVGSISYPIRDYTDSDIKKKTLNSCLTCKKQTSNNKFCSKICSSVNQRVVERPPKEELLNLLKENSFVSVGKMFNVSDNCIRKWIK